MADGQRANVVLTGFMGTGKTTVGRLLADDLGFAFVDTDQVIVERHGPVATIFAEQGEEAFRSIERDLAVELAGRRDTVIATGGGMLVDDRNVHVLSRSGRIFCLTASAEQVLARVTADGIGTRPLLAVDDPLAAIRERLDARRHAYGRFEQVPTDGRTAEEVAADVRDRIARG